MATTTEPIEDQGAPEEEDRSTRRLLVVLLTILGLAALGLLGLLLWLLRPDDPGPTPGQEAGYPIEVVTTITGYGQEESELIRTPLGVAFDAQGNVWIANTGQSRVEVYTSGGDYIRTVGAADDDGKLYAPFGLVIDPDRSLVYVADMGGRRVQIYAPEGGYVGHLPADDQPMEVFGTDGFVPYDVDVLEGRIIVSSNDGLYWFDQAGHVVARWGGTIDDENVRGDGPGMFSYPDSFTVDPESRWVYVADTANRRVVAIDPDGFERWVSGVPDADGQIKSFWQLPRSITLGPDGNLYVVDTFRFDNEGMGNGSIVVLSKDGDLLSEFGRAGTGDGSFSYPEQMVAGPEGLWAIADRENNRVVIFRLHTPYPEVTDLLARRFPETFSEPPYTWVTPPPTPPEAAGDE